MKLFQRRNKENLNVAYGDELGFIAHESYRLLRTNLIFSFAGEARCRTIGMTSTVKGEGKTTTAINLAFVLAENNARVCLIEADMRMPTMNARLGLNSNVGLSEVLTGQATIEEATQEKTFKNCSISVITSGRIPPNPAELLSDSQTKEVLEELKNHYDFIIVDLPPVTAVVDPIIVGVLLDGIVLVVGQGVVKKNQLTNAIRQIKMMRIRLLGFVRTRTTVGKYKYAKEYKSEG